MDSAARYTLIESVSITRKLCAAHRGMTYSDLTKNSELMEFVRDDLKDAIMYTEHKHGEKLDSLLSAVQSAKNVYDMFAAIETAIDAKLEDVCDLFGYDLPKIPADDSESQERCYYLLYFTGADAVKAGYALQDGKCYKVIRGENGAFCGQLEVVRDDESKLVAVSYIPASRLDYVVSFLAENGFSGMTAEPESYSDEECMEDQKEEESFVIPAWIDENTTETLENINGDLAVIYYWDDSFELDACRGYEIFPDGDLQRGRGMVLCGDADKAYQILSRKGFRY